MTQQGHGRDCTKLGIKMVGGKLVLSSLVIHDSSLLTILETLEKSFDMILSRDRDKQGE